MKFDKKMVLYQFLTAVVLTGIFAWMDRHEFKGDWGVLLFDMVMMTLLIFGFFMLLYGIVLFFHSFVQYTNDRFTKL